VSVLHYKTKQTLISSLQNNTVHKRQQKLTSFVGDALGSAVGLDEGDTDGLLLGLDDGDWLGLEVGCKMNRVERLRSRAYHVSEVLTL